MMDNITFGDYFWRYKGMAVSSETETWRNASNGLHSVIKFDRYGNEESKPVRSGQTIQMTVEERMLNMERAASDDLNVFKNGTFVPVRLVDSSEDLEDIQANPNLKSDDDLLEMLSLNWRKFDEEVRSISNVSTLVRLHELAEREDATMRQFKVIESRVKELDPMFVFSSDEHDFFGEPSNEPKAVTPK